MRRPKSVTALGFVLMVIAVLLLLIVVSELGVPGSFAMLYLPPGLLAVLIGGFVVYAAVTNAAYLHR